MAVSVNRDEVVVFNCTAGGLPLPTITWYKQLANGTLQPAYGNISISSSADSVYISSQIAFYAAASDSGNYVCRASGSAGMTATSSTANLNVIGETRVKLYNH